MVSEFEGNSGGGKIRGDGVATTSVIARDRNASTFIVKEKLRWNKEKGML